MTPDIKNNLMSLSMDNASVNKGSKMNPNYLSFII